MYRRVVGTDPLELDTTKDTNMQVVSVAGMAMIYSKRVLPGVLF